MLKIYHLTKKSVGYVYLNWDDNNNGLHENITRKFDSSVELKAYLAQVKFDYIRFAVANFINLYGDNGEPTNQLDISSLQMIYEVEDWMNTADRSVQDMKNKVFKHKPHFATLIKSATKRKEDMLMVYKCLIEFLEDEQTD